jgi:DNA-binding CsgD family transcriptional regulator/PAS domain-containing protein
MQLLLAVVQELYASAMQGTSEIWRKIYEQCGLLLQSEAGGFISTDKVNQAADIASLVGFDQQRAIQAYRDYGVEVDLLFMGTLTMGAGSTFLGTEKIGFRALQRSPFYDILSAPLDLRFVCGGILENDGNHHSALYFWRRKDQSDFDRASMAALAAVLPHVRQALEVQRRIRGPQLDGTPVGALTLATFQNSRHGILVLDEKGKVLFANLEAERIARSGQGIHIRNGLLCLDDAQAASEVDRLMAHALGISRDTAFAPMRPIRIPQKSGAQSYEFLMIPVTDGVQRAILPPAAAFMVAVTDPDTIAGASHQRLRGYGLTGAEARLCQALIRTGSLHHAADQLHISPSTARSHLKNVFTKLGVTSQVQLVMRLAGARPGHPW